MARLFLSFYTSLLAHIFLYLSVISPSLTKPAQLICGIDPPPVYQDSKINFEVSMEMDPELKDGESPDKMDTVANKDPDKKGNSEGEPSEESQKDSKSGDGKAPLDTSKYEKGEWKDLIKNLKNTQNLRNSFLNTYEDIISNGGVSGKYMYRYRHYEDMVVKEVYPTLNNIEKPFEEELKKAPTELEKHNERNKIIQDFREGVDPSTIKVEKEEGEPEKAKEPLAMNKEERQKYFDNTLTLPKEKQLEDFVDKFSHYDPDKGDLPLMFRDLYYQNLQRLAYTFSSDPSYFSMDYFEENLNKEDYLKNAMNMAADKKGTKTATEILFSIENIYEIQERAVEHYFQHLNLYQNLPEKKKKEIRMETIRQVIEKYKPIMEAKKIRNLEDSKQLYDNKRIQILDYLLKTTPNGYRQNDALFEKGRIFWERGMRTRKEADIQKAIQVWKEINPSKESEDEFLYKKSFTALSKEINKPMSETQKSIVSSIMNGRLVDALSQKKKREDKLLWKEEQDLNKKNR